MKLTILGYWGGYPINNEGTSSYLVESEGYHLLIDAGSASLISLENHLDPLELDAVILSHYHHDHVADIGVLQFMRLLKRKNNGEDRASLLPIHAHTENAAGFAALTLERVSEGVAYKETDKLNIGPFEITFMRTLHPVPCFAMRIKEVKTGKVLVYTADSGFLPDFVPFSEKADLLLADTNFFEGMENHQVHMTSLEVARIAKKSEVKTLVLTHLPQIGDLELLKAQAINHAEGIEVLLAKKDLVIDL
ncbi:MBL fold metallo-hydrolase [Carnobacterium maltaromaticum]|uniref:MBL fold metallo-hydrolase n=1 Tax=Carnobacterium maltaromaticum TaxID=2751 RepID=UPI0039BE05E4